MFKARQSSERLRQNLVRRPVLMNRSDKSDAARIVIEPLVDQRRRKFDGMEGPLPLDTDAGNCLRLIHGSLYVRYEMSALRPNGRSRGGFVMYKYTDYCIIIRKGA